MEDTKDIMLLNAHNVYLNDLTEPKDHLKFTWKNFLWWIGRSMDYEQAYRSNN